jgi:hypothetical protein
VSGYVDIPVFRPYSRRSRFADFIDWTDYRFDGPMRPRVGRPWTRRRQHPLVRFLLLLAIIWVVVQVIRGRRASRWF